MAVVNDLLHSPAKVTASVLTALGLTTVASANGSWPVYISSEPDTPDNCVSVTDSDGQPDGRAMATGETLQHWGVQVRIRAKDHVTGWKRADAIRRGLARDVGLTEIAVDGSLYRVHCYAKIGTVVAMGKAPESKRSVFAVNAVVQLEQLS